jgi:hypothetical protein
MGLCSAPIGFSQPRSELEAASTPADDDDFVCVVLHASSPQFEMRWAQLSAIRIASARYQLLSRSGEAVML